MTKPLGLAARKQRLYTEQEKADALAIVQATGGAKATGLPKSTVDDWRKNPERAASQEMRDNSKRDLLKELSRARWLYLDRLTEPEAVRTTSGYYAAITFKELNNAHQLLTGGPTQIFSLADYLRGAKEEAIEGEVMEVKAIPETGGSSGVSNTP